LRSNGIMAYTVHVSSNLIVNIYDNDFASVDGALGPEDFTHLSPFKSIVRGCICTLDAEARPTRYRRVPYGKMCDLPKLCARDFAPWIQIEKGERRLLRENQSTIAMHRRFAALDATPEAVLGFANRYGPLGVCGYYSDGSYLDWLIYESVWDWFEEIALVRVVVAAMDVANGRSKLATPDIDELWAHGLSFVAPSGRVGKQENEVIRLWRSQLLWMQATT
jgi:hypothetical protein